MKINIYNYTIFLFVTIVQCSYNIDDQDITIENYDDDFESSESRSSRMLWSQSQNPIIDKFLQVIGGNQNTNGDFFSFLRDSYPLPKGEYNVKKITDLIQL